MKYDLTRVNSNAFAIMAFVKRAMWSEGKSKEEIAKYIADAKSRNYDYLLAISMDMINKLNKEDA